ncbi:MAG TPA: hypothetical protein VF111_12760 [Thermoanaerobaculia bacterium]
MSATFVNSLRTRGEPLKLGSPSGNPMRLRAQVLEAWDAVRIHADPAASVRSLKELALRELYPGENVGTEFVVKLNGFEVLDEEAPLSATGARDGSTFLITDRRRRPVD